MGNTPAAGTLLPTEFKAPHFAIVTKALGAAGESADGRRRFRATASSTITDRAGHAITVKALEQMAARFREGITIFTDHKNEVEHAYGTTDTAEIIQRGQDSKTGAPIWDLDIAGVVNDPNPNARQLHDSIEGGYVKLGCSIDAFVLDHDRDRKSGTMVIDGLDVFAASIVGVPMNQRSWTQKALRAVKSFYGEPDEEDSVVTKELHSDAAEAVTEPLEATNNVTLATAATETVVDDAPEIVTKAQICTVCGGESPIDGCTNAFHSPAEPEQAVDMDDTADTAIAGIEIESKGIESIASDPLNFVTTEGGQEADPAATPETAPDVESASTDPALVQKALTFETTDVVELVGHVTQLVKALEVRDAELTELRVERDRLASENEDARAIIEKVMTMPLRPKTVAYVASLNDRYPDYLAPDVKALLIRKSQENQA